MKIIKINNTDKMDCKIHCILCGNESVDDGNSVNSQREEIAAGRIADKCCVN